MRDRDEAGRARNARPRDAYGRPLPHGAAGEERVPDDYAAEPAEALAEAQRLLDADRPFHAHEVLEAAWKAAPEAERDLWQGLAQLAVGFTHVRRGNARGAQTLLRRAAARIAPYADPLANAMPPGPGQSGQPAKPPPPGPGASSAPTEPVPPGPDRSGSPTEPVPPGPDRSGSLAKPVSPGRPPGPAPHGPGGGGAPAEPVPPERTQGGSGVPAEPVPAGRPPDGAPAERDRAPYGIAAADLARRARGLADRIERDGLAAVTDADLTPPLRSPDR